jgi:hypothetical protein
MRRGIGLFLFLAACQPSGAYLRRASECPEGYVPVDTARGEFQGRAISAAGVVLAIRERSNDQEATLDFWSAVVRKDLTEVQGYALRSTREIKGGRALLFAAPLEKTTAYYVALFVTPSRITTFEIAGPQAEVEKDLPMLERFIEKLRGA